MNEIEAQMAMATDEHIESLVPAEHSAPERDLLGQAFFWLHFLVLIYIVAGWALPWRGALMFYELFLPAIAVQWWFNANSCILNNIESKIRTGSWRSPANPEEGAWLLGLIRSWLGIPVTHLQVEILTYGVLALLWATALWRLVG
jgi:hypothetical protein